MQKARIEKDSMNKLKEFQTVIAYTFRTEDLLRQALTHSSYANEHQMRKHADNERLEFLGDAVLEVISSAYLYEKYPDCTEGELTKMRASLVCEPSLAACSREIRLGEYLLLGRGEDATGGRKRDSVLSDAFEALIGAIYLDGGFACAETFVKKYVLQDIEHRTLFYDAKTILQELVQGEELGALSYKILSAVGPDHDKVYTAQAMIGSRGCGTGTGHTKKAAEQAAAYETILRIREEKSRKG